MFMFIFWISQIFYSLHSKKRLFLKANRREKKSRQLVSPRVPEYAPQSSLRVTLRMFWHSAKSLWRWLVACSLRSSWGIPLHLDCLSLSVKKVSVNCELKKKRKHIIVLLIIADMAKESSWLPNPPRTVTNFFLSTTIKGLCLEIFKTSLTAYYYK